ncbi:hypothetical protein [Sphingobacterium sp.]|uniref:hypothetical protein n=1 Tax=Sphingobacterium sp. TaxID=341027 RepID=UPI0028A7E69A|nr:hypothetical protein [Sphingobacterium sp.]
MKRDLKAIFEREISSNRVEKSFPLFIKKLLDDNIIYNFLFEQFKEAPLIHDFDSYLELNNKDSDKVRVQYYDFINEHVDGVLDPCCYINNLQETHLIKLSKELEKIFIDMQKYVIKNRDNSEDTTNVFDIKQSEVYAFDFYSRIKTIDNHYVKEKIFQYFISEDENIYFVFEYCIDNRYNNINESEKWRSLKRNFNLDLYRLMRETFQKITASHLTLNHDDSKIAEKGTLTNFNLLLKELKRLNLILDECFLLPSIGKVKADEAPKELDKTFKKVDYIGIIPTSENYLRELQSDAVNEIMMLNKVQLQNCLNRLNSFSTFSNFYKFWGKFYVKYSEGKSDGRDLFDLRMTLEGYFSVDYPENAILDIDFIHNLQDEIFLKDAVLDGLIYQIKEIINPNHKTESENLKNIEVTKSINDKVNLKTTFLVPEWALIAYFAITDCNFGSELKHLTKKRKAFLQAHKVHGLITTENSFNTNYSEMKNSLCNNNKKEKHTIIIAKNNMCRLNKILPFITEHYPSAIESVKIAISDEIYFIDNQHLAN